MSRAADEPAPESAAAAPPLPAGNTLQLALATGAFALCFAVFGSISAMMPQIRDPNRPGHIPMNDLMVSIALAMPVLLGSVGRIPLGILTDKIGGRVVFLGVMLASIIPAVLLGWVSEYWQLLAVGFFLGIALASFSVGVGMASGWYPPQKQGLALGIYGAGNVGQSLAAFGAPLLSAVVGYVWGFWTFALLTAVWLVVFYLLARDAPRRGPAKKLSDFTRPLLRPMSWVLSLYYFLTFGGFVAMAVYLPTFLTAEPFGLDRTDAGMRTAGFVLLATALRPVGGWLADRVGGERLLLAVFAATAGMALLLATTSIVTFTIGALGMAAAIGLGNGAVFKMVPQFFPQAVGSVTGLVGAAGGLGGFFPPLVVGAIKQGTGEFTFGFVLLALFAAACLVVCWLTHFRATAEHRPAV
jgi:NNP family nitrate/nitrite transporter-like MFS transporter